MPALLKYDDTALLMAQGASASQQAPLVFASGEVRTLCLLGNWHTLFQLVAGVPQLFGDSEPPRGVVRVLEQEGRDLVLAGKAGVLPQGVNWRLSLSVLETLTLSATLLGFDRRVSLDQAELALATLELGALTKTRLIRLNARELRLFELAHAVLGNPEVLLLEDPFLGLTSADAELVLRTIERARVGRRLVFALPHARLSTPERRLAESGDEFVQQLGAGTRLANGQPKNARLVQTQALLSEASQRRYFAVAVSSDAEAIAADLQARGLTVSTPPRHPMQQEDSSKLGGSKLGGRFVVDIGEGGSTTAILEVVRRHDSAVLELEPISAAN